MLTHQQISSYWKLEMNKCQHTFQMVNSFTKGTHFPFGQSQQRWINCFSSIGISFWYFVFFVFFDIYSWFLLPKVNVFLTYHTDVLTFTLHVVVRSSLWFPAAFCPYDMSKCFFCLIFMYLFHLLSSHWGMFWLRMVIGIRILVN